MSEFVVLIYEDEKAMADGGQPLFDELFEGHSKFGQNNGAAIRGSHAFQPSDAARTLRKDGKKVVSSGGPYVTGGDTLTGYYVVEADDIAAAEKIAAHIPTVGGGVEIRPVMTFD